MAQRYSAALAALETNLHYTLMSCGSIFNDPASTNSQRISRTSSQMQHTASQMQMGFHAALDELEGELIRAKAILRQDLNAARNAQKKATQPPSVTIPTPIPTSDDVAMSDDLFTVQDEAVANKASDDKTEVEADVKAESSAIQPSTSLVDDATVEIKVPEDAEEDVQKQTNADDATSTTEQKPALTVQSNEKEAEEKEEEGQAANTEEAVPSLLAGLEMYANSDGIDGLEDSEGFGEFGTDQDFAAAGSQGESDMMGFASAFADTETSFDDFFSMEFGNDGEGQTNGLDDPIDESFFNLDGA